MIQPLNCSRRVMVVLLSVACWLAGRTPVAGQTPATWIAGNGNYADAVNWSTDPIVPLNDGVVYNVFFPASVSVAFDVDDPSSVQDLTLPAGSTLTINPGHSLTVVDDLMLGGRIASDNGTFLATAAGAQFTGSTATLSAEGGAVIRIAATTYNATGIGGNTTILSAVGTGTIMDLSSLQTISIGDFGGVSVRTIRAANNAVLDLSSLHTMHGGAGDDRLDFIIEDGAMVDLSALQTITGVQRFVIDAPTFTLPALTTVGNTSYSLLADAVLNLPALVDQNGGSYAVPTNGRVNLDAVSTLNNTAVTIGMNGVFNAPNLSTFTGGSLSLGAGQTLMIGALTVIDRAQLSVTGGATLAVAASSYDAQGLATATIFSASGAGSTLDLASVGSINVGDLSGNQVRTISATAGGHIDLSGLHTLTLGAADDDLIFNINTGGTVDLSSLRNIVDPSGQNFPNAVIFNTDAATFALPALEAANVVYLNPAAGSTVHLPAVQTANFGVWNVPAAGSIEAPAMTQMHGVTLNIGGDGAFNASNLVSIDRSTINLGPGQAFNTGALTSIHSARFFLTGGATLTVAAGNYDAGAVSTATIFSASGAGTLLNLASVTSLSVGDVGGNHARTISASANGHIDLSGLDTITLSPGDDDLVFNINTGGTVDLSSLRNIMDPSGANFPNAVVFNTDAATFTLPALEAANVVYFNPAAASTVSLPLVTTARFGVWNVPVSGSIDAPALTQMHVVTLNLVADGTFSAPNLVSIDGSRLLLSGGATLSVAATSYEGSSAGHATIFQADGSGTMLDLSAITAISAGETGGNTTRFITASNDGVIDLSAVASITAGTADDDIVIQAQTGGHIDLSGLRSVTSPSTFAVTVFNINTGGTMALGSMRFAQRTTLNLSDATSVLDLSGSLVLDSTSTVAAAEGATVRLGGNFTFKHTNEASLAADSAVLHFDGTVSQLLEVGGLDGGLAVTSGNFGWGQLVVGTDDAATTVHLFDITNNGNRSSPEALYLYGLGGPDGLVIRGGSTLVLNHLPVYVFLDGAMQDIYDLFGPGENMVAFGDGFIEITRPTTPGDFDVDGDVDATDINLLFTAIEGDAEDPRFDLNFDLSLDSQDIDAIVFDILMTRPGDTDLDRDVDIRDLANLATYFGSTDSIWEQGDFNGDFTTNITDLAALATYFGFVGGEGAASASGGAVPEPMTLGVLALAAMGAARRRAR